MKQKIFHVSITIIIAIIFLYFFYLIITKYSNQENNLNSKQIDLIKKTDSLVINNNKLDSLINFKKYEISKTKDNLAEYNLSNKSIYQLSKLLQEHSK